MRPKNLICETVFGSHLYGTATEQSDRDYCGIFLPAAQDILLGRIPRTFSEGSGDDTRKNAPDEVDRQCFGLHHFVRLASQGQTVAIDMLFTPAELTRTTGQYGWIWNELVKCRHKFLSKNMHAFVGYARSQAAKYSLKGDRLNQLKAFQDVLHEGCDDYTTLADRWDLLPRDDERENPQGVRELQIGGKWFGETTSSHHVRTAIDIAISRYGVRANQAAVKDGKDWKALSHAVRVSYELEDILTNGEIVFPLPYASMLLDIKKGEYKLEQVQDFLDRSLARVEETMVASSLPDKVDMEWCDDLLIYIVADHMRRSI
jgi:hypothetical protein